MVYDLADGLLHDLGASAAGEGDEGALRDAHDSEWLRDFERRRDAAAGAGLGAGDATAGNAPAVRGDGPRG
jgi:hypothetical protein